MPLSIQRAQPVGCERGGGGGQRVSERRGMGAGQPRIASRARVRQQQQQRAHMQGTILILRPAPYPMRNSPGRALYHSGIGLRPPHGLRACLATRWLQLTSRHSMATTPHLVSASWK